MKYLYVIFIFLSLCFGLKKDYTVTEIDPLQFPKGYSEPKLSVIEQLKTYPLPRYNPSNKLLHLFNWMNPYYMGGRGYNNPKEKKVNNNAVEIQKELITNWNYGIVIPGAAFAMGSKDESGNPLFTELANQNPQIPLHVITFWMQSSPKRAGYKSIKPMILTNDLDSSVYENIKFNGRIFKRINFKFPDSLIKVDGYTQKFFLSNIIKYLTRPINIINENGEEPPGTYMLSLIKKDPAMVELKEKLGYASWEEFVAVLKLHFRNTYSTCFMNEIKELKNASFNFYAVEGGPIDRFDWNTMKKCMTPINGNYYSTPDFYPRKPDNWKDWQGAWHGWKWIKIGRENEIKKGDNLFSPFVAAGWSKKQEEDIRPGQWLGLLKCLAGVGAEFYYVCYFSLSKQCIDPAKWIWQAAMPSYAQAVTSRFEDVLRNGNVLFNSSGNPIIHYNGGDKNVLVTIRKHNQKEKYIISGTYQPFTNDKNEIPEKKNVTISFANQELTFEIRRQGSVYVYEKTADGKVLFYQLDSWHENTHPDHWNKDFNFEAEVADTIISNNHIYTDNKHGTTDYTDFVSYISIDKSFCTTYRFTQRDSLNPVKYIWLRYKGEGAITFNIQNESIKKFHIEEKLPKSEQWKWHKVSISPKNLYSKNTELQIRGINGNINLDKFIISSKDKQPSL